MRTWSSHPQDHVDVGLALGPAVGDDAERRERGPLAGLEPGPQYGFAGEGGQVARGQRLRSEGVGAGDPRGDESHRERLRGKGQERDEAFLIAEVHDSRGEPTGNVRTRCPLSEAESGPGVV